MSNTVMETGFRYAEKALDFAETEYSSYGIGHNLDKWETGKEDLFTQFRKSPYWNEDVLAIITKIDVPKVLPRHEIESRLTALLSKVSGRFNGENVENTVSDNLKQKRAARLLSDMECFGYDLGAFLQSERIESEASVRFIKEVLGYDRVQVGMKSSRFLQKYLQSLDSKTMDDPAINAAYYSWAEGISGTVSHYKFVLSLNPADYLLMSFGNSWSSCHIINPDISNGGGNYGGQFRAGTLSYMNDNCTAVAYVVPVDIEDAEVPLEPKINRQLMMLEPGDTGFFQSRMYPDKTDANIRAAFKNAMIHIMSGMLGVSDEGWEIGTRPYLRQMDDMHYADYHHFSSYCDYVSNGSAKRGSMNIGNACYCLKCGENHLYHSEHLYCGSCGGGYCCEHCGEALDDDEVHWIDDTPYCRECAPECACCGEYTYFEDLLENAHGNHVCQPCLENLHFCCYGCGEWFDEDRESSYSPAGGGVYCETCYNERFTTCEYCEEGFPHDEICTVDGKDVCHNCLEEFASPCDQCGEMHLDTRLTDGLCEECAKNKEANEEEN